MATGSFDLYGSTPVLANPAAPVAVCLFDGSEYTILPNVQCLRIDYREGPEPPVARLQYLTADLLAANLGWPSQFEQLWPIDAQGSYVVNMDDRLVVMTTDPSGKPLVMFDGFAQIPQVDLNKQAQQVTFIALGVAVRLWDLPISGRVQRNGDVPATIDGTGDIPIDLPARFNPADNSIGAIGGYIGNCVATADYTISTVLGADPGGYPVFIDPLILERGDSETSYWFVSDVCKYLFATQPSPLDTASSPYVTFPTYDSLDAILSSYSPASPTGVLDGSAQTGDIQIRDYDASNKAPPDVIAELLNYAGFVLNFLTATDSDGLPRTSLQILRRDAFASTAPKPIYLASAGTTLDPAQNNTTAMHLARDCNGILNAWDVESQLRQVEITVYLAPGFQPNPGDEATPALWNKSALTNATSNQRRMYRWYIADECADGHWNATTQEWNETPIDFSPIFPPDPTTGNLTYVKRYRPGSRTIISKDAEGKPLKAVLEVMQGVTSEDPYLPTADDGFNTAGWVTITSNWQLLDDRLGIEITAESPEGWMIGSGKLPIGGNKIAGITSQSAPSAEMPAFALRLTTVIDDDFRMPITAPQRIASPTVFSRWRSADAKDHFQYCTIAPNSLNYVVQGGNGTDPVVARDDTMPAQTHANQLRSTHEFPTLAGSVTIPYLTNYYGIGDRVQIVQGRNANLQINVGVDQGETPTYPWVTAFGWELSGDRQATTLQLSDCRAEVRNL
jgi:hypothetical protein